MEIEDAFQRIAELKAKQLNKTAGLMVELERIEAEIAEISEPFLNEIEYLKNLIQVHVMENQHTVKTEFGSCTYVRGTKPRVKWDDRALLGYAATHEEILQFRSEGEPGKPSVRWSI